MIDPASAAESAIVSRDRVTALIRALLHARVIVERSMSVETIATLSGVKVRAIRSYMASDPAELREPPLHAALSIAVVLGKGAVNAMLSLIGYGGAEPLDEPDARAPGLIVAEIIDATAPIARAAADGRIDHTEEPDVRRAADRIVAAALSLSSMKDAG